MTPAAGRRGRLRAVGAVLAFLALALVAGATAGVVWQAVVSPPGYTVGDDGGAATSERGLAEVIEGDAWYTALGLGVGLALGAVAWWRLRQLGWPVVLLAVAGSFVAALLCWFVGQQLGPGELEPRLARARPGDVVPIELTVRAKVAVAVWPFAATVPILLGASLARDEEEPAVNRTGGAGR